MYDFRKINFGYADAHTEGEDCPILLKEGYLDISQVVNKAINTSTFLFLGYKGSGKSSLSEHLRLTQDDIMVDQQGLKDFPFKVFDKILDNEDRLLKYKTIWRWLLCVKVFCDLLEDETSVTSVNDDVQRSIEVFTQSGIFPVINISSLIKKTITKSIGIVVKQLQLGHTQNEEDAAVEIEMLTEYIKKLICSIREERTHVIVIDELDDILSPNGNQFYNIAALINEVKDLNIFFSRFNVPVKILVLCRTDMFERLPDPNINKIKQDKSFTFSWYREGINNPNDSDLIKLINLRTQLIYPNIDDAFAIFFPPTYEKRPIHSALLDFTRHTPRDFVQLINYIQRHCTSDKVDTTAITKGVKEYSTEYFKHEIANEMAGYIPMNHIEGVFSVLSSMRSRDFTYQQFIDKCYINNKLQGANFEEILRVMYDCSAIGHVYSYIKGVSRVTFKYRNRTSSFDSTDRILLHKGLWKAMNVNY